MTRLCVCQTLKRIALPQQSGVADIVERVRLPVRIVGGRRQHWNDQKVQRIRRLLGFSVAVGHRAREPGIVLRADSLLLPAAQDDGHHKADRDQQGHERACDRVGTESRAVGDPAGPAGRGKDRDRATAVGAFAA